MRDQKIKEYFCKEERLLTGSSIIESTHRNSKVRETYRSAINMLTPWNSRHPKNTAVWNPNVGCHKL